MNELTDEQIKGIFLNAGYVTQWSTKDIHPISYRAARDLIAADRARRQAEQEPAAAIAALERIAGDLQALCDLQALMLEAVGAGGVSAMMPKQLAVECDGDWSAAYQHPALQRAEIAVRDAEIAALNAERYRFVVDSTDHSVAKWHDYEGWYAIEEVDLDADMQAQAVKSS